MRNLGSFNHDLPQILQRTCPNFWICCWGEKWLYPHENYLKPPPASKNRFFFQQRRCFEQFRSHVKSIIELLGVTKWTTEPSISREKVLRRWVPCSANHLTLLILGKASKTRLWGYQSSKGTTNTHTKKTMPNSENRFKLNQEHLTNTPQNEKNWDNLRHLNPPPNFAFHWDIHVWSSPANHPRQASTRNCYEHLDEDLVFATVGTLAHHHIDACWQVFVRNFECSMYVRKFH